jgi:GNAT superfamily N-acetyltransferase
MTIRSTVFPSDIEKVRAILQSTNFFRPDEIKIAEELVEDAEKYSQSGYHFFFAEEDKEMIGFTCYGPIACTLSSFDLFWIAVSSSSQNKGVGKQLLKITEDAIKEASKGTRVYIETSMKELYESTRSFYVKQGYRTVSVIYDFYAPGDDKVTYEKIL